MIIFIRVVIITAILLVVAAFLAAISLPHMLIDRVRPELTRYLFYQFSPHSEAEFVYNAKIHFWPPTIEIGHLYIRSPELTVDGVEFQNTHLLVEHAEVELLPLLQERRLEIVSMEGRRFLGLMDDQEIEDYLMDENDDLSELAVSNYEGRCRIRGIFGMVSVQTMTLVGDWEIDDRGVITLENRDYYNRYGRAPGGAVQMIEQANSFDIRIDLFDEEMAGEAVVFGNEGLWISLTDESPS